MGSRERKKEGDRGREEEREGEREVSIFSSISKRLYRM